MSDGLNQARAMRVAEIINDYRTLLLHISQQNVNASQEEYWEEGFVVLRESLASAQTLMSANYQPCPVTGQGNVETEKAELQRVILDSSARRYQAHKIYLRAAAARRWAMARASILQGQRPTAQHAAALKSATTTLHQDLARITDTYAVSDLRAADMRAGHWVDDDPSLEAIRRWVGSQ
ncbi:hypothetical protein MYU51_014559 [Penicillium brevicompactum]|uniref:Uncharacterized protein n=1 Tax=Penicillium brevicompactum TaxID=5074 RepID=A0A9W9UF08_PENBR|nr:uncharacterized protein N7506_009707 [Penicillium brevicompactum]KAJ5326605.1 hypothetical protein N7506_009707 [Penicillium brevicompactum]KAJ5338587.1 hypothetical protein N7452_005315 [Penicillium brevicompactum]